MTIGEQYLETRKMKKIITIVLLLSLINLYSPVWAKLSFDDNLIKNGEKLSELIMPCESILVQASDNSSSKKYVQFCECALKQDVSSLDKQTQKEIKNLIYSLYIVNALKTHKITKQKKYLNKSYKISKKAVNNEMDDIDTLKTSMMVFSFKGNPKYIAKTYAQMCETNKSECDAFYDKYNELYNQGKIQQKENKKWIKNTFLVLFVIIAIAGAAYAGTSAANNKKKKNVVCHSAGSTTYCNEY